MKDLINCLAMFGAVVLVAIIVGLFVCFIYFAKDKIEDLKYEIKRKKRFNKPPMAKCYCIDCKSWSTRNGNGYCTAHSGWYTADSWFCWDAEPRDKDPKKECEKI